MTTETDQNLPPQKSNAGIILAGVGFVVLCGILYWGFMQEKPAPTPVEAPVTPVAPPVVTPEAVVTEQAPASISEPTLEPEVVLADEVKTIIEAPAITLPESDAVITEYLPQLNSGMLGQQFAMSSNALERGVAIVDNLRMGNVPYKLLPVGRPSVKFPFQDSGLAVTLDPVGFERYNGLADTLAGVNVAAVVTLYDMLSGVLEEVWSGLGYGDTTFDDAALGALNMILLAPATDLEARLYKDEANWRYEDDSLETLPALQKQLMRMGSGNAEKVQDKARELRGALLDRST
ncbi:DUF3014 domain-containing protein [Luminiphilus sp. nBUS_16]|uniref:DUF3014 domain-containing protein n=1 Tax=Luminiphilus sp. nBUS_16 TaxID=3395315 RepID=UPI003EB84026